VIQFALLGLGIAAVYTLLAQGIVLIYRGSGVVNLAQGSFALTGAFCYLQFRQIDGWSFWPAFLVSVAATTLLGVLVYHLVMRPLRDSAPVVRLIATLGIVIIVQAAAVLRYGPTDYTVASTLPQNVIHLGSNVVPEDQLWLFFIALVATVVLWSVSKFTLIGLASSAIAENQQAASTLGWSPARRRGRDSRRASHRVAG
jgi:branched-subunit amino acid ABC-type transport system permease component